MTLQRPAKTDFPEGEVAIDTGTAVVVRDPHSPRTLTLMVNGVPSSPIDLDDPEYLEFEYMQWMFAACRERFGPNQAIHGLHLGGGACAMPRALAHAYPRSRHLVAEIDGRLGQLVRQWFDVPTAPTVKIRAEDALVTVRSRPDASADLIIRDAFAGSHTPEHLTGPGFLAECARALAPHGVYMANCADDASLTAAKIELVETAAVFTNVAIIAEPAQLRGRRFGNTVILGAHGAVTGWNETGGLARQLGALATPARIIAGNEAIRWAGRSKTA